MRHQALLRAAWPFFSARINTLKMRAIGENRLAVRNAQLFAAVLIRRWRRSFLLW